MSGRGSRNWSRMESSSPRTRYQCVCALHGLRHCSRNPRLVARRLQCDEPAELEISAALDESTVELRSVGGEKRPLRAFCGWAGLGNVTGFCGAQSRIAAVELGSAASTTWPRRSRRSSFPRTQCSRVRRIGGKSDGRNIAPVHGPPAHSVPHSITPLQRSQVSTRAVPVVPSW
jgi:hypothetical protein